MSELWKPTNAGRIIQVRVRVRPLLPPPPEIGVRFKPQHLHWQLGHYVEDLSFGPGGRGRRKRWVVDREAEQHNVVLSHIYDNLIPVHAFVGLSRYAVVGTGSTPPDPSQVALANEQARTQKDQNGVDNSRSYQRVSNGVYRITVNREFTESQVGNKNLTEWGFSPVGTPGNNLMSRELFRDANGNPIVITPSSDQRLRLIYATEITIAPLVVPTSINIEGIGVRTGKLYINGGWSGTDPDRDRIFVDLTWVEMFASGFRNTDMLVFAGNFQVETSYAATPAYFNSTGGEIPRGATFYFQNYVPGSLRRQTSEAVFGTAVSNETIRCIALGRREPTGSHRYHHGLNLDSGQEFAKTSLYKLIIGPWTLTWGP